MGASAALFVAARVRAQWNLSVTQKNSVVTPESLTMESCWDCSERSNLGELSRFSYVKVHTTLSEKEDLISHIE